MEIRPARPDEFGDAFRPLAVAFDFEPDEGWVEERRRIHDPERFLTAREDGAVIGCAGAFPFQLTVSGGTVPASGVTWVAVLPTHRRRGVLSALMQRQLEDMRARGEPVAILWSSEGPIYGRYGYGLASLSCDIDLLRDRAAFARPSEPVGRARLLTRDEAAAVLPPIYERVRLGTPGMFERTEAWWDVKSLPDPDYAGSRASPQRWVALELDGRDEAYGVYRLGTAWEDGVPAGRLTVLEAIATSPLAMREIWRYLFGIDLVARIAARRLPVDNPLLLALADPARLRMRVGDGLWLRLVDVEPALAARSYAGDASVVLDVVDAYCPWNEGRWRVGADGVERTGEDADLRLGVADLGSAYLGGFTFAALAGAGRVEELRAGGLSRADALFRADRAPWCPEVF